MFEKPLYLTPDGYQRHGKNPLRQTSQNRKSTNVGSNDPQMSMIEKYRSTLNLQTKKNHYQSKNNNSRKVCISEQTAKLIALSIKGLLNS